MLNMFAVTPFDHPVGAPVMMVAFHQVKMIEDASFIPEPPKHEPVKGVAPASTEPVVVLEKPVVVVPPVPTVRTKITFVDGKTMFVKESISVLEAAIG
jgi:hypothetical protein